ncbi:MAG TPA: 3-hydroxyacyl-ACP dehydratase FabZ family protein [Thermoanaerobaculia bacterium]|nr:3-hydroxyacyl-ACP dehydratase FabZ family protein [Thermoanaerobaculia bacterium]
MRFVLVDRFLDVEPGRRATAVKTFDPSDPVFADHFPGAPIVPGVLLTEAIGQTGGWLLVASSPAGAWPLLSMIEGAKFRRFVRPGEDVTLVAEIRETRDDLVRVAGHASVRGERVADARLVFRVAPLPTDDEGASLSRWAKSRAEEMGLGGAVRA